MTETSKRKQVTEASETETCNFDTDSYIVAAIENRAMEVGLAIFDRREAKLTLSQFIETSRSYTTTLWMLRRYPPEKLIIVEERNTANSHGLNHATKDHFKQVSTPRGSFDDSKGELLIQSLSMTRETPWRVDPIKKGSYLAIGAAGALLEYFQDTEQQHITPMSLQVDFIGTEKHMALDLGTVECLGLTKPSKSMNRNTPTSLYRIMNKTRTLCGARLLKSNLLQPLLHTETLNCRFEAIDELVQNQNKLEEATTRVRDLPRDLDRICSALTIHSFDQISLTETTRCRRISTVVDGVMLLKEVLSCLPPIVESLASYKSVLLKGIRRTLESTCFDVISKLVVDVLDEDVFRQRSSALKRIEQCYAIKSGFDGFLDVARENFCRITEQIHTLADDFQTNHQITNVKVSFNVKRGFSFLVNSTSGRLPQECMVIERRGKQGFHFVTHELIALNARLKDATHDCMLLTQQALESVLSSILEHLSALRKLVDSLALLDLLLSFAELACSGSRVYTRPQINSHGLLVISQGRHPVLETVQGVDFTPNDTFMTKLSTCHVITGPNMSGKSTYLKQVALILIMAQVGSFVPAEEMSFSPRDKIFTRMGFGDSIETNSSSFMVEMQEMSFILKTSTEDSFVIIDELGRATSTADGVSIAWAVCEGLMQRRTLALIATHFSELALLSRMYPAAKSHVLDVDLGPTGMQFLWRLRTLANCELQRQNQSYGIELAKRLDFPGELIHRAQYIADSINQSGTSLVLDKENQDTRGTAELHELGAKLLCLVSHAPQMDDETLINELHELKEEFL